jgi:hypothetical protein
MSGMERMKSKLFPQAKEINVMLKRRGMGKVEIPKVFYEVIPV